MIRYGYNQQINPPAPFVRVRLRNPATGAEVHDVPAQLDIGADRTVLPLPVAEALDLAALGPITVGGLGGVPVQVPAYVVELAIHTLPLRLIEVLAHAGEPWILLGRDVLNLHRVLLDGPALALEIG